MFPWEQISYNIWKDCTHTSASTASSPLPGHILLSTFQISVHVFKIHMSVLSWLKVSSCIIFGMFYRPFDK